MVFQSYYSLISNGYSQVIIPYSIVNFNPIIVLFLTTKKLYYYIELKKFQSYYSLISNSSTTGLTSSLNSDFNPIIVLFLTKYPASKDASLTIFQSYYSLISNKMFSKPHHLK